MTNELKPLLSTIIGHYRFILATANSENLETEYHVMQFAFIPADWTDQAVVDAVEADNHQIETTHIDGIAAYLELQQDFLVYGSDHIGLEPFLTQVVNHKQ